ncbi:MAG TPA: hypothetical protein VM121_11935 [Acidimicrobiales bacterium]|nr:hypothetical protein [Acidimicrobiales bacterium]
MPIVVDGVRVHMATAEDTILAKLEWARLGGSNRRLRDVAGIFEVSGEGLDRAYLEYWGEHLGLIDDLATAEQMAAE